MPMLDANKLAVFSTSLALVVGIGVGVVINGDGTKEAALPGVAQPAEAPLDVEAYHTQVKTYREQNPTAVDLLSGPIEPGAQETLTVRVPYGAHPASVESVTGTWTVVGVSFEDITPGDIIGGTRITVTVRNDGLEPARFVGVADVP